MCCVDEPAPVPKPVNPDVLAALAYLKQMHDETHSRDRCNTQSGHWINEAFVIRLCAVLEAHHVVGAGKSIHGDLPGSRRVDLCRRLRNKLAHATGKIRSRDSKTLDGEVKTEFGLGEQQSIFPDHFILSKETVLWPMHASCREYVEALIEFESNPGSE